MIFEIEFVREVNKKVNNMDKEFLPYELDLRIKQLGFDEPCFNLYSSAPTYSQAFRWFRDNFESIQFEVVPSHWKHKYTGFYHFTAGFLNLETMEMSYSVGAGGFKTYEEAELSCLENLIEIVEQKQSS